MTLSLKPAISSLPVLVAATSYAFIVALLVLL